MHIWLDLILRELFFVALVGALGLTPASFLSERFDTCSRAALAPALGLCVGVCLTVTLVYWFPADDTSWLLIALALASLALAAWRMRGSIGRPRVRAIAQIAVVAVVILGSFDYPLAMRHTVGPVGGYQISDMSGYISESNSAAQLTIRQADRLHPPYANLAEGFWATYVQHNQQVDLAPLDASLNDLLVLGATETQTAFLIAVLLTAALGALAAVRTISGRPTWAAVLAGCLFAGPLFVELLMDGSQAAITGCSLFAPVVVIGLDALTDRRPASLILLALVAAGLQTVYPLFVPAVVIGGAVTLAVAAARRLQRGRPAGRELALAAGQLVAVLAVAATLTPVAFARNVRYWISIFDGSFSLTGLPPYVLPGDVVPGWILQTRDFYQLDRLTSATAGQFLLAAMVPALLIAVIVFAVVRYRAARIMVAVAAGGSLLAYYTWSSQGCGYCVQRNLIPVGALAPVGLGLGLAALAVWHGRAGLALAAIAALVTVVAVGHEGIVLRQRLADGTYLLDPQDRQAIAALPAGSRPVALEGFGEGIQAPMELPIVYNLVDEQTQDHSSIPTVAADNNGLFDFGGPQPIGPSFPINYRYVLTRLAGIATQRSVVARFGAIALEKRTQSLDVMPVSGLSVAPARLDPIGTAWVSNALSFIVVGGQPSARAWISLVFKRTVAVRVAPAPGVASVRSQPGTLRVCLQVPGSTPVRGAGVQLQFTPQAAPPPPDPYDQPLPARGVSLQAIGVSDRSCAGR